MLCELAMCDLKQVGEEKGGKVPPLVAVDSWITVRRKLSKAIMAK